MSFLTLHLISPVSYKGYELCTFFLQTMPLFPTPAMIQSFLPGPFIFSPAHLNPPLSQLPKWALESRSEHMPHALRWLHSPQAQAQVAPSSLWDCGDLASFSLSSFFPSLSSKTKSSSLHMLLSFLVPQSFSGFRTFPASGLFLSVSTGCALTPTALEQDLALWVTSIVNVLQYGKETTHCSGYPPLCHICLLSLYLYLAEQFTMFEQSAWGLCLYCVSGKIVQVRCHLLQEAFPVFYTPAHG